MKYFFVRICFNQDFLNAQYNQGDIVSVRLIEQLGNSVIESYSYYYHSFISLKIQALNGSECWSLVMGAFMKLYPNNANAITILINEEDSDNAVVMNEFFSYLIGSTEYISVCNTLSNAMKRVKDKTYIDSFRAMNYLISVDAGFGFSKMIAITSNMMGRIGLFPEAKDSTLEYIIGEEDKMGCTSVDTIIDTLWNEENYNKVVGFDLTYFLDKVKHDELRSFIKRLDRLQQCYLFMFRIPYLSHKALDAFREIMEDVTEVKTISVPPFSELEMRDYAVMRAWQMDLTIQNEAIDIFYDRICREKMDGRFYGLRTANKVFNEMVWCKTSHDEEALNRSTPVDYDTMNGDDLKEMAEEKSVELTGFEELSKLIGMEKIEKQLHEIVSQIKLAVSNDKLDRPCIHMRFVGSPGTGKTTVARIVGKIFKENGLLSKGSFFEYEAHSLIGEYIGQTAPKTRSICRDAYGSVLFIDEAYSLSQGDSEKGYGKEAITTLIAEMENHRDDMVIIMAGYTDEMSDLMEVNPGLRSRLPFILEFSNYTRQQLVEIFMSMARKSFEVESDLEPAVREYINGLDEGFMASKEFANARFIRNLYERTWSKAAYRASDKGLTNVKLCKADFVNASGDKEFSEKLMTVQRVGF
ncbi:MAG: AAA family ATPase [Marinilabiliaceae bacterium]|nr:AAA family ATPase [Marinilabiliaceae bacterium]